MHGSHRTCLALAVLVALTACGDEQASAPPAPAELTRGAVGHYCGMIVEDHDGPKGQIHLESRDEPLWFTSVRDTIAFTMLPEEPDDITAIYVHDIGTAESWDHPSYDTWINAIKAFYVIGSSRRGGMGAPEPVPFSDRDAAAAFSAEYGGEIVTFDEIPRDYILGDVVEQGAWDAPETEGLGTEAPSHEH